MKEQIKHMQNEPDIGSGEKSPGQHETESMIEQVGRTQKTQQQPAGSPHEKKEREYGRAGTLSRPEFPLPAKIAVPCCCLDLDQTLISFWNQSLALRTCSLSTVLSTINVRNRLCSIPFLQSAGLFTQIKLQRLILRKHAFSAVAIHFPLAFHPQHESSTRKRYRLSERECIAAGHGRILHSRPGGFQAG